MKVPKKPQKEAIILIDATGALSRPLNAKELNEGNFYTALCHDGAICYIDNTYAPQRIKICFEDKISIAARRSLMLLICAFARPNESPRSKKHFGYEFENDKYGYTSHELSLYNRYSVATANDIIAALMDFFNKNDHATYGAESIPEEIRKGHFDPKKIRNKLKI